MKFNWFFLLLEKEALFEKLGEWLELDYSSIDEVRASFLPNL